MQLLNSATRNYSWGSRTMIPVLKGEPASDTPVAELWFGAHPGDPSTVDGQRLDEVIAAAPAEQLGKRVQQDYGKRLPFLLKILAAAEPLSLQAHPSKAQAEEGFARENEQGIEVSATNRNYKDDNHKPELIVALTEFYAMAGFRPLERTLELLKALECPELEHYLNMLLPEAAAESENLRALFTTWITIPATKRKELIAAIVEAGEKLIARLEAEPADSTDSAVAWMARDMRTVISLNEQYPGDIGVLGALLLNHVVLQPGEAVYLNAGALHAYVSGLGVEIMANSDNVLRGGLTPKFVDVPELVKVLTYESVDDPRVQQEEKDVEETLHGAKAWSYPVPIDEFILDRVELCADDTVELNFDGPAIALCTGGEVELRDNEDQELKLQPGQAAWLPAAEETVVARVAAGEASQLFIARV
ncbi:mannose-6-phosphate isomerase, class I [Corynebacterium simulans]|uniref:mannose-6-phosphate isomerase, class I n=1 Tax=Corynebacterium TaxID=1716 RepID=UPI0020063ADA|nr:mannose-6-phosphate isomerase, class I [Corynebacterium simulans]MCK6160623.1 mannose-6-phosphate isomerase, class I [Corynebacterium simulans]